MIVTGYRVLKWNWDDSDFVNGALTLNATVRDADSDAPAHVISLRFDGSDADSLLDTLHQELHGVKLHDAA